MTLAIIVVLAVGGAVMVGVPTAQAVEVGLFVLVAAAVEAAVHLVGPMTPRTRQSPFMAIARPPPQRPVMPPEQLEHLRRGVWLGTESIGGWHFRLRPVLREITDGLLEDRYGIGLDGDPEAAAELLGPRAWDLLRADIRVPDDRWADGVHVDELASLVSRIEELPWA